MPEHQAFVGDVDELARAQRHVANQIHPAGVAMPAIDDWRNVDIDDVAVLQRPLFARDSVADDMVDRDAAAFGIASIAERSGNSTALHRHSIHDIVESLGGGARNDIRGERVEDLRSKPSGPAHSFERFRTVKLDHSVSGFRAVVVGRDCDILRHWRLDTHSIGRFARAEETTSLSGSRSPSHVRGSVRPRQRPGAEWRRGA